MIILAETASHHKSRRFRYDGLCDLCISAISAESEKGVYPGRAGMDRFPNPARRPPFSSASSVVNPTDHGSMTTEKKAIGISERLFIDHYPLVIERTADAHGSTRLVTDATGKVVQGVNYDAFGNALGFNAATALTTYLYVSMPFGTASGNYYDHARYFNTGTGSFTQADYGYTGSLANPMTDLPYAFTGGDPIDMLDSSGHDFSIGSLTVGIGIASLPNGAVGGVIGGVQGGLRGAVGGIADGLIVPGGGDDED